MRNKRKKPANPARAGILAVAAACAAAAVGAGSPGARAIVVPTPPPPSRVEPLATPTGTPNSTVLPLNSSLFFVLDGTISSHESPGTVVHAHLRDPIILAGMTIARAGTPINLVVTQSAAAQVGNVDGEVEMYFESLSLTSGLMLPLTTPTAHVNPSMTAGQQDTRDITDTVGDIFVPGHYLYHILRKGSDVTLRPGTVIRARTAASVHISKRGVVAVTTPPPFASTQDTPHPDFDTFPLATPPGFHQPTPKPSPSVHPTGTP